MEILKRKDIEAEDTEKVRKLLKFGRDADQKLKKKKYICRKLQHKVELNYRKNIYTAFKFYYSQKYIF